MGAAVQALKFFEFAENISAAWIWTRIKRVGTSRKSLLQEELGYIEGGSQTLVNALVQAQSRERRRPHPPGKSPVGRVLVAGRRWSWEVAIVGDSKIKISPPTPSFRRFRRPWCRTMTPDLPPAA